MAAYDDPSFLKGLKLLHSTSKDSTLQLMHLLQEVIDAKYGVGTKKLNYKLLNLTEEPSTSHSLDVPKSRGSRGASPSVRGPSEKSSRSSTPPSEPLSIRTSPDRDDGDLGLEIFEDDIFCTVCKGIRVTSDNRLLECNGCRSLYHQECHVPPVDSDPNDPRMVWNCGDCTKKILEKSSTRKSGTEKRQKSEDDSNPKKRDEPAKKHRSEDRSEKSSHKRSEKSEKSSSSTTKSHSSSKSSSSSGSSKSEHRSSSSKSSNLTFNKQPGSPNSKSPSCTANIIAADKRLQNMKKKAAAKMQEKRSNPK